MRTLLKIISLSLLVSISLFANIQKIDECKVDVYYANGIMIDMDVTKAKHEEKWNDMVDDMFLSNPEEYKKIANVKISYNASQGFFDDVFESAEQVMSNEWGWEKFSIFFRTYLETHNIQEAYDTHIPDLTAQVTAYKESIKLGHGVIVIAHSQGNYYTNEAYKKLDEWMKDYFHMFGVATPANHVAGFPVDDAAAPYVKFHNDFINSIVTSLPSNLDDTRHHGFPSIDAHDFYESYMKEETSKKMITDFIIDEIQKHSKNDSQWELDQELNKGTKDFKITLKHRFDTTITSMQDVEVYPFNASKKLYHVVDNTGGNGWVKASCGGSEVFDYWDGKKDSEVYLIDNIEKEKINLQELLLNYIDFSKDTPVLSGSYHIEILNYDPEKRYTLTGENQPVVFEEKTWGYITATIIDNIITINTIDMYALKTFNMSISATRESGEESVAVPFSIQVDTQPDFNIHHNSPMTVRLYNYGQYIGNNDRCTHWVTGISISASGIDTTALENASPPISSRGVVSLYGNFGDARFLNDFQVDSYSICGETVTHTYSVRDSKYYRTGGGTITRVLIPR